MSDYVEPNIMCCSSLCLSSSCFSWQLTYRFAPLRLNSDSLMVFLEGHCCTSGVPVLVLLFTFFFLVHTLFFYHWLYIQSIQFCHHVYPKTGFLYIPGLIPGTFKNFFSIAPLKDLQVTLHKVLLQVHGIFLFPNYKLFICLLVL